MAPQADIALIGLAVMGQNLILNMDDHGFVVVAYNRSTEKVDRFLANEAKGTNVIGAHSFEEMVALLKRPPVFGATVKSFDPAAAAAAAAALALVSAALPAGAQSARTLPTRRWSP